MFSFITHVRDQPNILATQLSNWERGLQHLETGGMPKICWPELVLIDDYSTPAVDTFPDRGAYILARSDAAMQWNYGVKNLGAHLARSQWLLFTNVDHMPEPAAMRAICEVILRSSPKIVHRFARYNPDKPAQSRYNTIPHIGTLLMHRSVFELVNGYDEDFSGRYGHDDTHMRDWLRAYDIEEQPHPDIAFRNFSGGTGDADFLTQPAWSRDTAENAQLLFQKQDCMRRRPHDLPVGARVRFNWRLKQVQNA